ncbi:MAG: glycosyltransferase [Hyphomicrobiaceae bacterium]
MIAARLSSRGGGVSAVVEALSRHVAAQGVNVRVFGLDDEAWLNGDRDKWDGAPVATFCVKGPRALGYAPGMAPSLIEWAPAIVHTHGIWMHPSRSVLQWARCTGRPHVISPHGMLDVWALRNSRLKKRLAGFLYEHEHLRTAAALHALGAPEAAAIQSFGLHRPIHVIPNGIDSPPDQPVPRAPWSATLPPSTRVMLFLGRLHPKKNILPFLQAWRAARRLRPAVVDWRLVIAGWEQGGHGAALQGAIRELQLSDDVLLLGPLFGSDKDAAFRNAAAFVLPSVSEGLPMTVLEACSYGIPVLMTEACNLGEGFAMGAARRLDLAPDRMAADLSTFLSLSPEELRVMGRRGRVWMERDFAWAGVAQRMTEVYCRTIEGAERSARVRVA